MLDAALQRLVPFDLSLMVAYPKKASPVLLHDGIRGHGSGDALNAYLKGTYLLDPFYTACALPIASGLYRMRELAPDKFFEGDYVHSWQVHPCISMESGSLAEEIGYLIPIADGLMAAYSLMRRHGSLPFGDEELMTLREVEPVVREVISRHWRRLDLPRQVSSAAQERSERLEHAFSCFATTTISTRERMVVQLILRGHSTRSIAKSLKIADGTVKNHRKNIYAKLKITSQRELFLRFVDHVLGPPDR